MKIWVDTASGTWGEVDGDVGRLLIVDLDAVAEKIKSDPDHGAHGTDWSGDDLYQELEMENESAVIEFAVEHGRFVQ